MVAQTKIWARKCPIQEGVKYALNPEKTRLTENRLLSAELEYVTNKQTEGDAIYLTSAWNCDQKNAAEQMMKTKEFWGKGDDEQNGHVLIYHMDQSFMPGEVTPELAYKIGQEFAERVFTDRYEVVMATHVDKKHIHNHFLINAVSVADGKRFRNEGSGVRGFYFSTIRPASDKICREYGLSVIGETTQRKKYRDKDGHYQVWKDEKPSGMNKRDFIRIDFDNAISCSNTFADFLIALQNNGYEIKVGDNVMHMAIRAPGTDRYVRCRSLGCGYDEESIRLRLERPELYSAEPNRYDPQCFWTNRRPDCCYQYVRRTGYKHLSFKKMRRMGIVSSYYQYMRIIGLQPKNKSNYSVAMRENLLKFRQLTEQYRYLMQTQCKTASQIQTRTTEIEAQIKAACFCRNKIYAEEKRMQNQDPDVKERLRERKEGARRQIAELRKEMALCNRIYDCSTRLPGEIKEYQARQKEKKMKARNKHL